MKEEQVHEGAFDENAITNHSGNAHFGELLAARVSRREALFGGMKASAAMVLGGVALAGCAEDGSRLATPAADAAPRGKRNPNPLRLGFGAVPKHLADVVAVPAGYSLKVLYALGDPIDDSTAEWADDGSETGASYEQRAGDHHDGMAWFGIGENNAWDPQGSRRGLLVLNHENITEAYLHEAAPTAAPRPEDEALKEINCHGVSVIEVAKADGEYGVVRTSAFNRRITPNTPVDVRGPAAGTRFLVTSHDKTARSTRGTINNCANGYTPWGTYLTCEENWAGYFKRIAGDDSNPLRTAADVTLLKRYGINQGNSGANQWTSVTPADSADTRFKRWDASVTGSSLSGADDFRHEPNNFGWVVEIDPFNPDSRPVKRTALGRMGHEGAWVGPVVEGQPVVFYMGDDARFEYVYKFVSAAAWDAADAGKGLAAGNKYLDKGTLYVAKFSDNGRGKWVELTHLKNGLTEDNALFPFTSQAAVLVATRLAADVVGATKMDRPEWAAVNPRNGEVYLTLTNNSNRAQGSNPGTDAANPRNYIDTRGASTLKGNVNGHTIRWREDGNNAAATAFTWDIFLFGAQADADPATVNISDLTDKNDHSSPDGLWFDPRGVLWIQTDDGAYVDVTNCMMLAAVPGSVGDGEEIDISGQATRVGKTLGNANLRRFLVGPVGCEITGVDMTPDGKAMFVNIQHPGESGDLSEFDSHWPASQDDAAATARPRSATIVITRDDGGVIGLA